MVTKYGMSSLLGPTSIAYEDNGRSLSSETRAAVEAEVCDRPSLPTNALPLRPCVGAPNVKTTGSAVCILCHIADEQNPPQAFRYSYKCSDEMDFKPDSTYVTF